MRLLLADGGDLRAGACGDPGTAPCAPTSVSPAHSGDARQTVAPDIAGSTASGPELALQRGGGLLQGAAVGAGGEVFPAAVAHDEHDVGVPAGGDLLVGDAERSVQDGARRDP